MNPSKTLIILGSSRSDGDTAKVAIQLAEMIEADLLDLQSLNFSDYDYQSRNSDDDFLPIIRNIVNNYDHIILATPIYWYTMSAIMKRFLDRISDCLRIEKDTGRKFRGMSMSLLSVSNDVRNQGYEIPFKLSADYLGMDFVGDQHVVVDDENNINDQLIAFIRLIKKDLIRFRNKKIHKNSQHC